MMHAAPNPIRFNHRQLPLATHPMRAPAKPVHATQTPRATAPTSLTFQGKQVTELSERQLLSSWQLSKAIHMLEPEDPYLGAFPPALLQATGQSETQLRSTLDTLARQLRREQPGRLGLWMQQLQALFCRPSADNGAGLFTLGYLGEGSHGTVYSLQVGQQRYAFKVFKSLRHGFYPRGEIDAVLTPYREAANGLYLSGQGIQDVAKLYAAHPKNLAPWLLLEQITRPDAARLHPAHTMKGHHLCISDDHRGNRIGGILVDFGGHLSSTSPAAHPLQRLAPDTDFARFSSKPESSISQSTPCQASPPVEIINTRRHTASTTVHQPNALPGSKNETDTPKPPAAFK